MGRDSRVKQLSDLTRRLQSGELTLEEYRAQKDALPKVSLGAGASERKDPTKLKDPTPLILPTLVLAFLPFLALLVYPPASLVFVGLFGASLGVLLFRHSKIKKWLRSRGIDPSRESPAQEKSAPTTSDERLSRLVDLYTRGEISAEEFSAQKLKLAVGQTSASVDAENRKPVDAVMRSLYVLIGVALVFMFVAKCSTDVSTQDRAPNEYNAQAQCKRWVEERLKAPSTAKFSNEQRTPTGVGSWTISGTVDSQNSFGAMVRNDWSCKIAADGDMWRGGIKLD